MVPFNRPYLTGNELDYIRQAHANGRLAGDGQFTRRCSQWLQERTGVSKALLTHSCTAALEMAAILLDIGEGDEVIMPSFTFVSTANAFVLRGAKPVFVDIRPDTLNIDEALIEASVGPRTRAIVPVHYAGVSCEMDRISDIAGRHGLAVVEDAAQGILARYRDRALGSMGDLGAFSFHETKNVMCGEGGALLVNNARLSERAEIVREKGTNRSQFFRGQVDKYTWCDYGSSYLCGEMTSAFLAAQLEEAEKITARRKSIWNAYHEAFASAEASEIVRRPIIPAHCDHNAHMYYLLLRNLEARDKFIKLLADRGISAVFHYQPLHSSSFGKKISRISGSMEITEQIAQRIVRLPLWVGLDKEQNHVIEEILRVLQIVSNLS